MAHYVLDAHALIFFFGGSPRLGARAKVAIEQADSTLFIPVIALAEVPWISGSRRVGTTPTEILSLLSADRRCTVVPLTERIVRLAHNLPKVSEMHDRQIVATAIDLNDSSRTPVLLTKDADIVASALVPTAW